MPKRFTDTAKWKKSFIRGLDAKHKLLWFYILDDCDHAGIWEVDMEIASIRIGEDLNYDEAFVALGCQISPIGKNRWWIKDFIFFQYGANFSPTNKMYGPVMAVLNKHGLQLPIPHQKEHLSPIDGVKVQVKEEVRVEVKDQGVQGEILNDLPADDPELVLQAANLQEKLCEYFGVRAILTSKKYSLVNLFVSTVCNRGQLLEAIGAFEKYQAYKARSQEAAHGIEKWVGTIPAHFQDGVWNEEDWGIKLKNYNARQTDQGSTNGTGSVIEAGKSFGKLRAHNP